MSKKCSFTGHRFIKDYNVIKDKTRTKLIELIEDGYTEFYNGGALGFDTMCALLIIEFKKKYDIRLHLILPCKEHFIKWNEDQKMTFNIILNGADSVEYAEEVYCDGCMLKRNRMLCDNCDILVSHCLRSFGGSYYTVNYAKKTNKTIINIT